MRKLIIAAAATFALAGLAACGESAADKQAEIQADALEEQAAAAPTEAQETALNAENLDAFLDAGLRLVKLVDVMDVSGLRWLLPRHCRFPRFMVLAFEKP